MSKNIIEENNKLIAEFMGYDFIKRMSYYNVTPETYLEPYNTHQFNSSWNWLMAVVQKIESIDGYRVSIEKNMCSIYKMKPSSTGRLKRVPSAGVSVVGGEGMYKFDIVYKTIVEFIKQYNKNNNDHEVTNEEKQA